MKSNKTLKVVIICIAVIAVAALCGLGYRIYRQSRITEIAIGLSDIELTDELKEQVKSVAVKADEYLQENRQEKILTSQYGLLYSYKNKANILPSDVNGDIKIPKNIINEMDILYVSPGDVSAIKEEPSFLLSSQSLAAFASVNTSSGYYIADSMGNETILTEGELKNLLLSYSTAHGNIINPPRDSEIHAAIINAAGISGENFDIKHIACDDKYAVVVANDVNNPADIREIALVNNEGWSVIGDELAKAESSYIDVNYAAPDMDLGLMPVYNISDFDEIKTDEMQGIADSLIGLGMMSEADKETMYACGCGRFAYIQLENGKRLVGYVDDDGKLEFNEAEDITSVIAYMLSCQENPPVFIAKFE